MKTAVVCIASPLEEKYLKEFVAWHIDVCHADRVFIYANDWPIEQSWAFLGDYAYNVAIIRLDGPCQQINAYNDWLQTFGCGYDWAAFIDVDEFICLKKDKDISTLLSRYDDVAALAINWKLFGSNGKEHYEDLPVVHRFTKSQVGVNQHIKTIVNLKYRKNISFLCPHFVNIVATSPEGIHIAGPFNPRGTDDIVYIAHYATKSKDECIERRQYRRADCGTVRDNIDAFFDEHNVNDVDNFDLYNKTKKVLYVVAETKMN